MGSLSLSPGVLAGLLCSTLGVGALLGVGVVHGLAVARPSERPLFEPLGPSGPLGQPVSGGPLGAAPGLPPLPAGVKLDERGVVQGIERQVEPGTVALEWEALRALEYTQALGLTELPPEIEAVNGKRVTMVGFLQPLYDYEDIRQFALVGSHWSCCYGYPPGLTGVANVTLASDQPALGLTMEPLRVVGTFRAKETKDEGWLISIYSLDDARVQTIR